MLRHCFFLLLLCFLALGSSAGNVLAQEDGDVPDDALSQYQALETIPGVTTKGESTELPAYLTSLFNFAIAIVGIAALVMITIGGFWYLTSAGNASRVSTAKSMVTDAILGLLVALFAWLILNTINPQLVSRGLSGFSLDPVDRQVVTNADQSVQYCSSNGPCYPTQEECERFGRCTIQTAGDTGSQDNDPSNGGGGDNDGDGGTTIDENDLYAHNQIVNHLDGFGVSVDPPYAELSLAGLGDTARDNLSLISVVCDCDVTIGGGVDRGENAVSLIATSSFGAYAVQAFEGTESIDDLQTRYTFPQDHILHNADVVYDSTPGSLRWHIQWNTP